MKQIRLEKYLFRTQNLQKNFKKYSCLLSFSRLIILTILWDIVAFLYYYCFTGTRILKKEYSVPSFQEIIQNIRPEKYKIQ